MQKSTDTFLMDGGSSSLKASLPGDPLAKTSQLQTFKAYQSYLSLSIIFSLKYS
jgi:hypothetical protein